MKNVELGLFWFQALVIALWQLGNWPVAIGVAIGATVLIGVVPVIGYAVAITMSALWVWLWYEPAGLQWALAIGGAALLLNLAAVLSARDQAARAATPRPAPG